MKPRCASFGICWKNIDLGKRFWARSICTCKPGECASAPARSLSNARGLETGSLCGGWGKPPIPVQSPRHGHARPRHVDFRRGPKPESSICPSRRSSVSILVGAWLLLEMLSGRVYNLAMIDRKLSEYFAMLGRKSAKVRMKTLSARRRKQIARNAAKARWAKRKRKG
jgi:hypothetical protein